MEPIGFRQLFARVRGGVDAQDPVMFRVASDSGSVAVVTDLGQVTTTVQASIRDVDALVLETNHDVEMLFQGPYPWHLKQRIRGKKGHLSNEEAAELLCDLVRFQHEQADIRRLQLIVGAHVSEKNNTSAHSLQALQNAWARCSADYNPEFLVADAFPWSAIVAIGCYNNEIAGRVNALCAPQRHQPRILVRPNWYY